MADFVICDSCNSIPGQSSIRKYSFATCGHLICPRCLERGPSDQCCICKKKCSVLEIGKLDISVQHIFMDPVALEKKQYKQLSEALSFQKQHRTRYLQFLQHQAKRARKLQEFVTAEVKKRKHLERVNEDMKNQLAQMKRQLARSSTSQMPYTTPDPLQRYRSHGFDNTMTVSSVRTTTTMESGNSLPIGAEAANFHQHAVTPYLDDSMSSPQLQFAALEDNNVDMSRDSMNALGHGTTNPFSQMWQGNMSAMTLGAGGTSQSSGHSTRSFLRMSNILPAFRH